MAMGCVAPRAWNRTVLPKWGEFRGCGVGGGKGGGWREWGEVYPAGNPTKIGSSGLVWDEKWQF